MSSTISSNLSGVTGFVAPTLKDPVSVPADEPVSQNYTPLWMVRSAGTANPLESLGIRMPSASGDLAVLLAQVSLSLESTVDESRKNRDFVALAGLASALYGVNLQALRDDYDKKSLATAEAKATADALKGAADPLVKQSADLTGKITSLRSEIASLEASLANDTMTPEQRTAKSDRLTQAKSELASAMSDRESVDIALAGVRITSLERQVADLQARLGRATSGSTEASTLQSELNARQAALTEARGDLAEFMSGSRSTASRDAFSAGTNAAVGATIGQLADALGQAQADQAAAAVALSSNASTALVAVARAAVEFSADKQAAENEDMGRDLGAERLFENIAEGLLEAGKTDPAAIRNSDAAEEASRERVAEAARTLVGLLAEVLATLADQVGSPKEPMKAPPDMVASRVRVGA